MTTFTVCRPAVADGAGAAAVADGAGAAAVAAAVGDFDAAGLAGPLVTLGAAVTVADQPLEATALGVDDWPTPAGEEVADCVVARGPYFTMTTTSATSAAAMSVTMTIRERRMILVSR